MRLIDADKIVADKEQSQETKLAVIYTPTAFDVDKVIGKLNELKTYKLNMADAMSELMKRDKLGTYVCLEDVIEVIKESIK